MSLQEFSTLYERPKDIYQNIIRNLTGLFNMILRLGTVEAEDKNCLNIAARFLKDFYSINDTEVSELEEYERVKALDRVYNAVLSM